MPNPFNAPECSVAEVDQRRAQSDAFHLVDVREDEELTIAAIEGALHLPLSALREQGEAALPAALQDKNADCVLFCHKGARSARVTAWLRERGWTRVKSMDGGIDAWAKEVDSALDLY